MAGKSTFLRQNALIAILAQIGACVPAEAAEIGLVSQIFSRVGASDDLARGRSTFMVEMVETAAILNQADDRALVILDEIGRGTATYDGLSIAWATLEHLHGAEPLPRDLRHPLPRDGGAGGPAGGGRQRDGRGEGMAGRRGLPARGAGAAPPTAATACRWPASPACRRPSSSAPASSSRRWRRASARAGRGARRCSTTCRSSPRAAAPPPEPVASAVEARLRDVHPDALTPREALDLLYELRALLKD